MARNSRGAPTKYKEEFDHMAFVACSEGAFTDKKLGQLFSVAESTINDWKHKHPDFSEAVKRGKEYFDSTRVEKSFLKRCLGYRYNETTKEPMMIETVNENGDIVSITKMAVTKQVRKEIVPDARACMDWLCNRQPERWKKLKHVELSGKDAGPVKTESMVAVPSGPMTIAEWEKQVKEARKADPELEPGHIPGNA